MVRIDKENQIRLNFWFQYLIHIENQGLALSVGILSLLVALIAIIIDLIINQKVELSYYPLFIPGIIIILGSWFIIKTYYYPGRAKHLIKEILNGNISDSNVLNEEWKRPFKNVTKSIFIIGLCLIFIGILFVFINKNLYLVSIIYFVISIIIFYMHAHYFYMQHFEGMEKIMKDIKLLQSDPKSFIESARLENEKLQNTIVTSNYSQIKKNKIKKKMTLLYLRYYSKFFSQLKKIQDKKNIIKQKKRINK